jgi:2-nitrobenzoate nitroreductase
VPRPIALVTTLEADGRCNAAPFSAFNYMSEDPPIVALGLQVQPDEHVRAGEIKDTTRNIAERGEFVVNLMDEDHLDTLVDCAIDFPPGVSELDALGLECAPSVSISAPRLATCAAALECRQIQILHIGTFRSIVIGEVLSVYFRDGIVDPLTLKIDVAAYRPIGRLFGSLYCRTADTIAHPTPTFAAWQKRAPHDAPPHKAADESGRAPGAPR